MKISELFEMSMPSETILSKKYYHGTHSKQAAAGILKNGIQPPDLSLRTGNLRPVEGKVYLTNNLGYAQIYAIGGDIAGSSGYSARDEYGYIFVINGSELKDVQPDEDVVGEFLENILNKRNDTQMTQDGRLVRDIYYLATKHLSTGTLKKVQEGEYNYYARAGKVLLKRMSDYDKIKMIEYGAHIAHTGALIPFECWRLDLKYIPKLKRDGSNFFEYAKKITNLNEDIVHEDGLMYELSVTDYYKGETFGFIVLYDEVAQKKIGYLDWSKFQDEVWVKMIEIYPEYRRKGYGTKIINFLKKSFPTEKITYSGTTTDGDKFLKGIQEIE